MHTAEACVATKHAARYLTQMCRHTSKMGQHLSGGHFPRSRHAGDAPPPIQRVEWSETIGTIRFGEGRCILQADDNALLLRVEAGGETALRRLQDGIARRLETFGHRERLTVHWQPASSQPIPQSEEIRSRVPAPDGQVAGRWRSRPARNLALVAVAIIALGAHLGLLGATLAGAAWTKWGADAILAFIVLKFIVTLGVHAAGGPVAIRHGKTFLADRNQRQTRTHWEGGMTGAAPENSRSNAPGLVLHQAKLYDFTVWLMTLGRERAFREKILDLARLNSGEAVLDIGCGTGALAIVAKRNVGPSGIVNGVDASSEMIARAQEKARMARSDVTFQHIPAQALPFADAQFDVVFTTLMLHHLSSQAREQCAQEMKRVLKPGGRVVAVDFAQQSEPKGFLHSFRRHGRLKRETIIASLEASGLNVRESGALGFRNLQYVIATHMT